MTVPEIPVGPPIRETYRGVTGRVGYRLHRIADLRAASKRWPLLSDEQKLAVADRVEPVQESWSPNRICEGLDLAIARTLSQSEGLSDTLDDIAVGTDDTTPEYTNESINTELDRATIASYDRSDNVLTMRAFFDRNQANTADGEEITEAGTITSGGYLANHSTGVDPVTKNDQEGLTMVAEFTFDASGGS